MAIGILGFHKGRLRIIKTLRLEVPEQLIEVGTGAHLLQGEHIRVDGADDLTQRPLLILGFGVGGTIATIGDSADGPVVLDVVSRQGDRFSPPLRNGE